MKKALTLSIIIPVYNEEQRIKACLDAIARQTVLPQEVILVDNNSTDRTVEIARNYPFVRVVREKKQGRSHARNAGFDAAKTDILGRIDADSIVAADWVERVLARFEDATVDGLTGLGSADMLPRTKWPQTVVWSWWYFAWARNLFRVQTMWGANMALRRHAWLLARKTVINDDRIVHEDEELSLCILEHNGKIIQDNQLRITTGGQTYHYLPKLVEYTWRMYNTKAIHARRPEFRALPKSPPLFVTWVLWLFPGILMFPIFFTLSFLLFPLDYVMQYSVLKGRWLD